MGNSTFDEGVEPGGLRNADDIKILICYLLKTVGKPLTFDNLNEILQRDGLCNYFGFANALHGLLLSGHVDLIKDDGGESYKVTGLGVGTADTFERRLPVTIREKAVKAAIRLLARIKRDSENRVDVYEVRNGYTVECSVYDMGDTLMSIKVFVPDEAGAEAVKRQFRQSPESIYKGVLALLTGDSHPGK